MSTKTLRITTTDLSQFASQGVERALAARQTVGVELNAAELEQVGGGAYVGLNPWIVNGGIINGLRPYDLQQIKNVTLNSGF